MPNDRRPPKAWWSEKTKEVREGNPSYTEEQVDATVGKIWSDMSKGQKEYRRSNLNNTSSRIEDDTPIMPWIVADSVVSKVMQLVPEENEELLKKIDAVSQELSDYLADHAQKVYDAKPSFKKLLNSRGNKGRDSLYAFMQNWISGEIIKRFPEMRQYITDDFAWRGASMNKTSAVFKDLFSSDYVKWMEKEVEIIAMSQGPWTSVEEANKFIDLAIKKIVRAVKAGVEEEVGRLINEVREDILETMTEGLKGNLTPQQIVQPQPLQTAIGHLEEPKPIHKVVSHLEKEAQAGHEEEGWWVEEHDPYEVEFAEGEQVRVKKHESGPGRGLSYPAFDAVMAEPGFGGGWDVFYVRPKDKSLADEDGTVAVYGFSIEKVKKGVTGKIQKEALRLRPLGPNRNEVEVGDWLILFSYQTPVAAVHQSTGEAIKTDKRWSNTTARHINQWLGGMEAKAVPQEELEQLVQSGGVKEEPVVEEKAMIDYVDREDSPLTKGGAVDEIMPLSGIGDPLKIVERTERYTEAEHGYRVADAKQLDANVDGTIVLDKDSRYWKKEGDSWINTDNWKESLSSEELANLSGGYVAIVQFGWDKKRWPKGGPVEGSRKRRRSPYPRHMRRRKLSKAIETLKNAQSQGRYKSDEAIAEEFERIYESHKDRFADTSINVYKREVEEE